MTSASKIIKLSEKILPSLVQIREHLHAHPELSFQEWETSKFIKKQLQELNIPYTENWAKTGIIATIGKSSKRVVGLRADMDALPIEEENEVAYRSKNIGVMHACGHDVHMTCLLGAAQILKAMENELEGEVRLIFQPGEELLPGGASQLIAQGALDGVNAIFGLHVQPKMEVGKIGFCPGPAMASCDEIYIKIKGKGGHAAMPDQTIDPIYVSAQLICQIQALISREKQAFNPSVLGIGKINSVGGATNIIPDEVMLEGTLRCLDEVWRARAKNRLREIINHSCAAFGATAEINIVDGYPCLNNNVSLTHQAIQTCSEIIDKEDIIHLTPRMTSEDFAYYSHKIPACFYRLGIGKEAGVHTPHFDIDPACLAIGSRSLAHLAKDFLKNT